MVPRAQLRLFAPLESFPPSERARWAAYVDAGRGLSRREAAATEHRLLASRLLAGRAPRDPEAALVRRAGRRTLVCPLQLDVRAAHALASFRDEVAEVVLEAALPDARDRTRLEHLAAAGVVPHILDEPWAVPLHWFVAFAPEERHLTDPPEGDGPRVTHLTTCRQAATRIEEVLDVVEGGVEDGEELLAALAGTATWISAFDPGSVLELDYGPVADLLPAQQLREDTTCADLWEAVEALRDGDVLAAAAAYGVARARWTPWRARQQAS